MLTRREGPCLLADQRGLRSKPLSSFPECWGEECQDGEDLQPPKEHTDGKYKAAEGIDDLVALRGTDLPEARAYVVQGRRNGGGRRDRKSTRLNSSHANISYAVFCLKKK